MELCPNNYITNFRLTVSDNLGNEDHDDVTVTVAQDQNEAPVADAGKDSDVTLPLDSILFNGSRSHDDFRVSFEMGTLFSHSIFRFMRLHSPTLFAVQMAYKVTTS